MPYDNPDASPARSRPAWSNVPGALAGDPALSARAKLAALALGLHTNADMQCRVSRATLAADVGVDVSTMKRGLRELRESGWLIVQGFKKSDGTNEANVYLWNFRQAGVSVDRMKQGRAVRPITRGRGGVSTAPQGGVKTVGGDGGIDDPQTNSCNDKGRERTGAGLVGPPDASPERGAGVEQFREVMRGLQFRMELPEREAGASDTQTVHP